MFFRIWHIIIIHTNIYIDFRWCQSIDISTSWNGPSICYLTRSIYLWIVPNLKATFFILCLKWPFNCPSILHCLMAISAIWCSSPAMVTSREKVSSGTKKPQTNKQTNKQTIKVSNENKYKLLISTCLLRFLFLFETHVK